jgi:transposase-like protein
MDIDDQGYCAVARTYGVSDNAIRKWVAQYEREFELLELGGVDGE